MENSLKPYKYNRIDKKFCKVCRIRFTPKWVDKLCCSPECRDKYQLSTAPKKCAWCKSEFSTTKIDKIYCQKLCFKKATRNRNYATSSKESKHRLRRRNQAYVYADKISKSCSRCSERRPSCLDYHHIDSTTKTETVAVFVAEGRDLNKLMAEMSKCIILCANCHRVETHGEGYKDYSDVVLPTPQYPFWRDDKLAVLDKLFKNEEVKVSEQTTCQAS